MQDRCQCFLAFTCGESERGRERQRRSRGIYLSELKEFSNSTLTLSACHWFPVTPPKQHCEPHRALRDPDWEQISQIPIAFHLSRMMDSPPVSHQSSPAAGEVTPGPDLSSYTTSSQPIRWWHTKLRPLPLEGSIMFGNRFIPACDKKRGDEEVEKEEGRKGQKEMTHCNKDG